MGPKERDVQMYSIDSPIRFYTASLHKNEMCGKDATSYKNCISFFHLYNQKKKMYIKLKDKSLTHKDLFVMLHCPH